MRRRNRVTAKNCVSQLFRGREVKEYNARGGGRGAQVLLRSVYLIIKSRQARFAISNIVLTLFHERVDWRRSDFAH